ncbi:MAG: HAD family hydrolase [Terriglobia bacterium]
MKENNHAGIRLLIFDLDGTLIDSETDLTRSVNATREHLALGPLAHEEIASYVGQGVATLMRRALGAETPEDALEAAVSYFLSYYHEHMLDHTQLYPGVRETLDALKSRILAVLTNKPVNFSRQILEGLRVDSRFAFLYGGNSFDRKKPDPVGILRLMKDTHVPPANTMIIGDSGVDIQTGRNAGIWTCAVSYGIGAPTLAHVHPDFLVNDFRELPAILEDEGARGGAGRIPGGAKHGGDEARLLSQIPE